MADDLRQHAHPRTSLRLLAFAACLALAVTVAACDGGSEDSTRTFEHDAFPFTFEYPSEFELADEVRVEHALGGSREEGVERVGVARDDDNLLLLSRIPLRRVVDRSSLTRARAELDELWRQVDADASRGQVGRIAGFPSLEYEQISVDTLPDGESRIISLFDGDQQYQINCQSTPEGRDEVEEACELALDTLARR